MLDAQRASAFRRATWMVSALALVAGLASTVCAQAWEPASEAIKAFGGNVEPGRVIVQFTRGTPVRVENHTLVGLADFAGRGVNVPALPAGTWSRLHTIDDAELEAQRAAAVAVFGPDLPDLRLTMDLRLAPGVDLEQAIDALRARPDVLYALPSCPPVPQPVVPSYVSLQRYMQAPTNGVGSTSIWTWPGGTGSGIRVIDLEYSWNTNHFDLPAMTSVNAGTPQDPFNDTNHGTAVMGVLVSRSNGEGTTGAVHGASPYIAPTNFTTGYNLPGAITAASNAMRAGDVIVIEQQWGGPNGGTNYVPVEWFKPNYDAIRQAVGAGRVVVAAAGNGNQNLDAAIYSTGNGGHWPFLLANDSGAIMVGAGAAPAVSGGSTTDRSRLGFSNYGATLDLQGWGERVHTLGYGSLYSTGGINFFYTATFNGTSSATPVVASAAVGLQAVYRAVTGTTLTPAQVRQFLRQTGSPQQSGANPASQNIGPRPSVQPALMAAFNNADCNSNLRPDPVDIAMGTSADVNTDGIPDECQPCPADFDGSGFVDSDDFTLFVSQFELGCRGPGEGASGPDPACLRSADFDGTGFVDADDFIQFVTEFSTTCP
ncbi:MAG: S8 family serine peptidase [Planctomycetota bacterium]|nr:S8 family serine peptidase [Planctomycetota bacterium]